MANTTNVPRLPSAELSLVEGLSSASLNRVEYIELLRVDLNALSAFLLPQGHLADFPEIHCNIWSECISSVNGLEKLAKFAIGLPRGHAKTQLMKFLLCYCVLFTERTFLLVVCNVATLAQSLVADVMGMLASENVLAVFGDCYKDTYKDTQELKRFNFLGKNIIIRPIGCEGSLRGTNIDNRRPELILCDDMQSSGQASSIDVSTKILQWFLGTLMKARSYAKCTIIYVGNMYPDLEIGKRHSGVYACILRNLQLNKNWRSWIVGAILTDNTALWEEVISMDTLMEELEQDLQLGQEAIFYAEVLNDPNAVNTRYLQLDKVQDAEYTSFDIPIGKFFMVDPSLGKKTSDDQMVGLFYVYDSDGPVLQHMRNYQCSAPELVRQLLQWALEENVPLIVSETVGYQATLVQWLVHYMDELGIEGITCVPISPLGVSKPSRILLFFKAWMLGEVKVVAEASALIKSQAISYVPTNRNNVDDMLDVMAYAQRIFREFGVEYMLPLHSAVESHVDNSLAAPSSNKGVTEFL